MLCRLPRWVGPGMAEKRGGVWADVCNAPGVNLEGSATTTLRPRHPHAFEGFSNAWSGDQRLHCTIADRLPSAACWMGQSRLSVGTPAQPLFEGVVADLLAGMVRVRHRSGPVGEDRIVQGTRQLAMAPAPFTIIPIQAWLVLPVSHCRCVRLLPG